MGTVAVQVTFGILSPCLVSDKVTARRMSLTRTANYIFYTDGKHRETIPSRYEIGFSVSVWAGNYEAEK